MDGAPMGGPAACCGDVADNPCLGPESGDAGRYGDRFGPWDGPRLRSLLHHLAVAGVAVGLLALLGLWVFFLVA